MNDMASLENQLRSLAFYPPAALRNRVLRAVDRELLADRPSAEQAPIWSWAAAAALVVIVLNLSFASAAGDSFTLSRRDDANQLAMEIQALVAVDSTPVPAPRDRSRQQTKENIK